MYTHCKLGSEGSVCTHTVSWNLRGVCAHTGSWDLRGVYVHTHCQLGSEGICKHILCCLAETNTTVQSNYTPINVS